MRYRVEALGPFRLIDLNTGTLIPLRSNARLLSYLALRTHSLVARRVLISEFFPEVDAGTASNRLRVALSRFRKQLPGIILEQPDGLTLNSDVAECDVAEFRQLTQDSIDTPSELEELEVLVQACRYFHRIEQMDDWDVGMLADLFEAYYQASIRVGELGLHHGKHGLVEEVTSSALRFWPEDVVLWKQLLESSFNLGQGEAAVRRLRARRDRDLIASDVIQPLIKRIQRGETSTSQVEEKLTSSEGELALNIFEIILSKKKSTARAILCSPETLTLAGSRPKIMLSLLERVIGEPEFGDEHWERCMARTVGLRAWLNDAQGVLDAGELLVKGSSDPVILRATWNAIGVAYSIRRQWPQAMEAVNKTVHYAQETGSELDVLSAQGNGASYLWLQGRFEESEKEYHRILTRVKQIGTPQSDFEFIIGSGNRAFIPVMQGDWVRALPLLEEAFELRQSGKTNVAMGTLSPCLAMVRMMLGQQDGVLANLRQGFIEANETESERAQQITFEFAACTLARTCHMDFARSVLDWVLDWRLRTNLPRAEAEVQLFDVVFGDTPLKLKLSERDSPSTVGREILSRLRAVLQH